jgi:transcriptional regulator with XRE-family HTH domain
MSSKQKTTNISKQIGENLTKLRKKSKLTQSGLAAKLNLSMQQIQKYEAGVNSVRVERFYQIASALQCTVFDLLSDISQENEDIAFVQMAVQLVNSIARNGNEEIEKRFLTMATEMLFDCRKTKLKTIINF